MKLNSLIGKTISSITRQAPKKYPDDTGFLKIEFTDDDSVVLCAYYNEWNEDARVEDEYATGICITQRDDLINAEDKES